MSFRASFPTKNLTNIDCELISKTFSKIFNMDMNIALLTCDILLRTEGIISFSDLITLAKEESLAKDVVLDLYWWRILIPLRLDRRKDLSWASRPPSFRSEELYEIPSAILYAFLGLIETGKWDYRYALRAYLNDTKDPCLELAIEAVSGFLLEVEKFYVKANAIAKACRKVGMPEERIGILIAELKDGGFISPAISVKFLETLKKGDPIYEVNKAVFVEVLKRKETV